MRYGFFNSEITGTDENDNPIFDRAEQADFFAKYFSSFVHDGVLPGSFDISTSGSVATLSPGVVFIQGYFGWETNNTTINLQSGAQTIIAKLNLANRTIAITTKTAGLNPTRSGDIYELYLYDVNYSGGTATVTDYRTDSDKCGRMGAFNPTIYSGTAAPASSLGEDGDIYIQY